MRVVFSSEAFEQYVYWQAQSAKMAERINQLITMTMRDPFKGIGKPEPLRGQLQGWWSRRIDLEHRLIYRVTGSGDAQSIEIASCRFHYGD